jgi:hypothetical protein
VSDPLRPDFDVAAPWERWALGFLVAMFVLVLLVGHPA